MSEITQDALTAARHVEMISKKLSEGITVPQVKPGQMLVKVAMTNKREDVSIPLHGIKDKKH